MSRDNSKRNNNSKESVPRLPSDGSLQDDDDDQPMGEMIQNILANIINSIAEPFNGLPPIASTSTNNIRTNSHSGSPPPLMSPDSRIDLEAYLREDDEPTESIDFDHLLALLRGDQKVPPKSSLSESPPSSWSYKNDWKSPMTELSTKNASKNRPEKSFQLAKLSLSKLQQAAEMDNDEDEWQFQKNRRKNRRPTTADRLLQKQIETMVSDDTELTQELCESSCRKLLAAIPEYETRLKHAFDDAFQRMSKQQFELIGHLGEIDKILTVIENAFHEKINHYRSSRIAVDNGKSQ